MEFAFKDRHKGGAVGGRYRRWKEKEKVNRWNFSTNVVLTHSRTEECRCQKPSTKKGLNKSQSQGNFGKKLTRFCPCLIFFWTLPFLLVRRSSKSEFVLLNLHSRLKKSWQKTEDPRKQIGGQKWDQTPKKKKTSWTLQLWCVSWYSSADLQISAMLGCLTITLTTNTHTHTCRQIRPCTDSTWDVGHV